MNRLSIPILVCLVALLTGCDKLFSTCTDPTVHLGNVVVVGGEPGPVELRYNSISTIIPAFTWGPPPATVVVMPLFPLAETSGGVVELLRDGKAIRTVNYAPAAQEGEPGNETLEYLAAVAAVDELQLVPPSDPVLADIHARAVQNIRDSVPRFQALVQNAQEGPIVVGHRDDGSEVILTSDSLRESDALVSGTNEAFLLMDCGAKGSPVGTLRISLSEQDATKMALLVAIGAGSGVIPGVLAAVAYGAVAENVDIAASLAAAVTYVTSEYQAFDETVTPPMAAAWDQLRNWLAEAGTTAAAETTESPVAADVARTAALTSETNAATARNCPPESSCGERCLGPGESCCVEADNDLCLNYQTCRSCGSGPFQCSWTFAPCCGDATCDAAERCVLCNGIDTCVPLGGECADPCAACRMDQVCEGGSCRCAAGSVECGSRCASTACNGCSGCGANASCFPSGCTCVGAWGNCNGSWVDGCEINFLYNNASCGGCNLSCPGGTDCQYISPIAAPTGFYCCTTGNCAIGNWECGANAYDADGVCESVSPSDEECAAIPAPAECTEFFEHGRCPVGHLDCTSGCRCTCSDFSCKRMVVQ